MRGNHRRLEERTSNGTKPPETGAASKCTGIRFLDKGGNYVPAYPTAYRSELSEAAIQKGIQFAKSINAEVTGFHVVLPFHVFTIQTEMLEDTKKQYESESKVHAEQVLDIIKKAAEKGGRKVRHGLCNLKIIHMR
jgi:hypothetical protein